MQAVKSKNTAPEMAIRSALFHLGLRYRVDSRPLNKVNCRADVLFTKAKVAVFIDGCFWHGCPIHGTSAKENADFWKSKILRNKERDLENTEKLENAGWAVIRVWEHENPEVAAKRISLLVQKRVLEISTKPFIPNA